MPYMKMLKIKLVEEAHFTQREFNLPTQHAV
jgi:hypothetical protein